MEYVLLRNLEHAGTGDGVNLIQPMGIALDTNNDLLLVSDSDNDRIQVFNLNSEPASFTSR